jgi:hypothetical protein
MGKRRRSILFFDVQFSLRDLVESDIGGFVLLDVNHFAMHLTAYVEIFGLAD